MKTALITGGSSGIGFELAKLFIKDSYSVILIANDEQKLAKAAEKLKGDVQVFAVDLSWPQAAKEVHERYKGKIDVLVNNAGFGTCGAFEKTSLAQEEDMITVNITAVVQLTKYFLPTLHKRKGRILNVSSTAAYQPGPYMTVYYATKAFVSSFSEALRYELRESGVSVTTLSPGATKTGFAKRAKVNKSRLFAQTRSAAEVATAGYKGLMRGKRVVIPGSKNKLLSIVAGLVPRTLATTVAARLNRKK